MVFETLFYMAFRSPYTTVYAFMCTVILCFLFQVLFFRKIARKNNISLSFLHYVGIGVFLVYLLIVYRMTGMGTLWDIGRYEAIVRWHQIHFIPFQNQPYDLPFTLLNIIMTIPLGFLLPSLWPEFRKLSKVAITGFCLSMAIELSQLLNHRGTSVEDLMMNTLGAIIGYFLFAFFYKLIHPLTPLEPKMKSSSFIIANEGVFYMIFSFLGMFLFFNPQDVSELFRSVFGIPISEAVRAFMNRLWF